MSARSSLTSRKVSLEFCAQTSSARCSSARTTPESNPRGCMVRRLKGKKSKSKGKAVPLHAWSGPEGSRKLRFTDFTTRPQDGGKVVSLMHRPPLPRQEIHLVLLEAESTPEPHCDQKDYVTEKNRMTPSGIEPATCRLVA